MKRFVLNGNERTDDCFTAALFQTQLASLSVLCGAVRLATELERTHLTARRSGTTTAWPPVFVCRSKCNILDLDLRIFDSERFITEVQKMPALYS
jgi:hypothetical protein